ncbi:MAG: NAD(+) diphosphatase [Burkholderiales bacterium]
MIEMPFSAPGAFTGGVRTPNDFPDSTLWFVFRETELLVREDPASASVLRAVHPSTLALEPIRTQYLGVLGDHHCLACELPKESTPPDGWAFRGLRALFGALDEAHFALAGRALQVVDWDRTHLYCGRCGTPTFLRTDERSRECPSCRLTVYPRLAPALMALVRKLPNEILLGRSHRFVPGMYSALAGFAEPGETLEQCLHREVFEEVGIRVKNLRYFASQPWPFPHSLMIAFIADYESGEINPEPLEIEAAQWFPIDALPKLPMPISIARRLIDAAIAEMAGGARS